MEKNRSRIREDAYSIGLYTRVPAYIIHAEIRAEGYTWADR